MNNSEDTTKALIDLLEKIVNQGTGVIINVNTADPNYKFFFWIKIYLNCVLQHADAMVFLCKNRFNYLPISVSARSILEAAAFINWLFKGNQNQVEKNFNELGEFVKFQSSYDPSQNIELNAHNRQFLNKKGKLYDSFYKSKGITTSELIKKFISDVANNEPYNPYARFSPIAHCGALQLQSFIKRDSRGHFQCIDEDFNLTKQALVCALMGTYFVLKNFYEFTNNNELIFKLEKIIGVERDEASNAEHAKPF